MKTTAKNCVSEEKNNLKVTGKKNVYLKKKSWKRKQKIVFLKKKKNLKVTGKNCVFEEKKVHLDYKQFPFWKIKEDKELNKNLICVNLGI